ncbi:MAG: antibiotic biosynthesis monooxygenase [Oceanospirillaceae bacterium]|nr:antibiotic biosynthesis monooxygenase [Oceanospirillaceae bacterium]
MAITRINEFHAATGKSQALYEFLISLKDYIANSKGCISCEVLRQDDQDDIFIVIEKWQSQEDHQLSLAHYPKENMSGSMALIGVPPTGNFYHE